MFSAKSECSINFKFVVEGSGLAIL